MPATRRPPSPRPTGAAPRRTPPAGRAHDATPTPTPTPAAATRATRRPVDVTAAAAAARPAPSASSAHAPAGPLDAVFRITQDLLADRPAGYALPRLHRPTIRPATTADLPFLRQLAARETDAVGFLPAEALREYTSAGAVLLATENDEPAGYLLAKDHLTHCPAVRPILQAAVCYDVRRRHLGLLLVAELIDQARAAGRRVLQLKCREELHANEFWRAAGFSCVGWQEAGRRRAGRVLLWAYPVGTITPADLLLKRVERNRGPGGFYSSRPVQIHDVTTLPPDVLQRVMGRRAA